ncbi:RHS repeat-associated core domain-containing protein [Treponema vincentii]|uniref:RHS repeat-associated core domain-containing protein n=1 Tax=Treponema vincentii TaxID=69710 RepID=UPI0035F5D9F9
MIEAGKKKRIWFKRIVAAMIFINVAVGLSAYDFEGDPSKPYRPEKDNDGGGGSSEGSHDSGEDSGDGGGSNSSSDSGNSDKENGDSSEGENEREKKENAEKENDKQREETKEEAERIEKDEKEAEKQNEQRDKEGIENNEKKQQESNSVTAGDPVRVTSGTYLLEETELGIIKRSYTSGKKGSGKIGKWWVSNLDERIIRSASAGAVEFYQKALANEQAAKALYEGAESKEKSYASQWKGTVSEGYLGEVKGKYDSVQQSYGNAVHIHERYRLLTALNKYSVNSDTPEYYWGCGNEKLVFVDVEGFPNIYEPSGKGVWTPIDKGKQQYSKIESRDGNGAESEAGFILYEKGGVKKYFNKWGLLEKIEYSPYESMTFIRNEKQQAVRIEMPHHQEYRLKYTEEGLLSSISNRAGQTVKYGYENGSLVSVTDEAGDEVRYAYSVSGLLEKIIKPDGSAITIVYGESDAEGNVYVTATEDEEGNRETFEYHRDEKYTVHRNHSGIVESIRYDDKHRTVKEEKADGSVLVYEYDERGNKTRVIENGLATSYEYDGRGNCTGIQYADGSRETFRYNERDQKTYAQERDGVTAEWVYDSAGRCIEVRRNGVRIWEGVYDSSGRLTASKEADLGQQRYSYDANDFVASMSITENGTELVEHYVHDTIGRIVRYEDAAGQVWTYAYEAKTVTEVTPLGLKKVYWYNNRKDLIAVEEKDSERNESRLTQLSYDRRHLVKEVKDGAGNVIRYEYRADGKVISEKRGAWEKRYEYDSAGRIAKIVQKKAGASDVYETSAEYALQGAERIQVFTDGLGNRQVYRYDAWSRLTEQVNAAGEVFKRMYSAGGRALTAQGRYGGAYRYGYEAGLATSFGKDGSVAIQRRYNPLGFLLTETDRDGRQTRYSYTERGLLRSISTDEGSITYSYDGAGRVIEQAAYTEANGHTYRTRYRYAGRTVTEERGAYITRYNLDGWGKPILKTNGEGWAERYRYDGAGRISEVRDDIGLLAGYTYNELSLVASERHGTELPVVYTYNAIGLLEKAERGNEILLTRSYDKAGRLVREKKQGSPEKTYRYDALGRLTEVRSAGAVQAQYRYGTYGKTVTYTDGAGSEYLFEKDSYGLLTTERDRLGKQRQYRYSAEDELTEAHERNGGVRSVTRRKGSEITTYRDGSRYEITKDITGTVIFEKGIDSEGKRTSEVTYRYDEAGQLIEQADDAGDTRIIYRYNKAGYRTEMQTNDRYVVYEVDGRGRVTEATDRKQYFKVKAFYDENDREVKHILGNGNKQDYTYDEAGRLLGIVETDSNWAIIRAECYGYDGEGRRIFTADEKGNVTRYVYDEQYRIKEVQYPASEELRAYHREEAKEARLFIDEGAASHYREIMNPVEIARISANFSRLVGARTSNLGSMVGSIQLVWSEQYTYDANGNIATKTTPYGTIQYSYDKENRLLTRGAVHYTYDEEGNLLREEQSDYYLKRYEYSGFNRMEMSDIINYRDNIHVITDYRYDSFGRRIHTAERTKSGMRTIYDGLSFEVVKEAETFLGTRGITSSATGEANLTNYTPHGSDHTRGTRYYFIRDRGQELRTGKNGEALPDRTKGVRTYLYLNGERVAVNNLYNTNHGQYYYGSDILGSVKFITGGGGQELNRIEYDIFGGIYKGNSPYGLETGYTGKPYDSVTGLSDYGFRDYSPAYARFITEDPIRDGENWFSYVGNNPVNWVDPWGLSASDGQGNNGNANLLLSGLTKTLSGSVKTVAGLAGTAAGMFASAVLVADNGTVVLTVDDAALLVTVPFTAASGKYALNGAKEAVDGLSDLTAGVVGTTKTLGTWIGGKAKSALDNIWGSNKEKTEREKSPKNLPPGTRELDRVKLPKGVDHRKIKQGLGLGAADWTGITPDGDIIVNDGEGNAEVAGNLEDFQ